MGEHWRALSALRAWELGQELDGGLAFADELREAQLDWSLASLGRIDALLDSLRALQPPSEAVFVGETGQANLLQLLAWYAGELMGRAAGEPAHWGSTEGELPSTRFRDGAACRIGAGIAARFRPLQAICARLFGPTAGSLADSFRDYFTRRFTDRPLPARDAVLVAAPTPSWPADLPGRRPELDAAAIARLRIVAPPWEPQAEQALAPLFAAHAELLRNGRVVWGALIAPHNLIGAPHYRGGLFLQLVYDPAGRVEPTMLAQIADRLYNEVLPTPEARQFIYSEHPQPGLPVPVEVSAYPLWMSGSFVPQEQLPDAMPSLVCLPLLIDPRHPEAVAVLPAACWPQRLREEWLAAGEAKHGLRVDAGCLRQRIVDALQDPARRQSLQEDMDFQSGAMYFHGESLPRNYVTARERWEAGCRAGNPFAMIGLGLIHQNGLGTPIDVARARRCFHAAAALGLEFGDYELGRSYLVEGNTDMAQLHLRRAAQRGYAPAAELLREVDAGAAAAAAPGESATPARVFPYVLVTSVVLMVCGLFHLAGILPGWLLLAMVIVAAALLRERLRRGRGP